MKKLLILPALAVAVAALTGCGGHPSTAKVPNPPAPTAAVPTPTPTPDSSSRQIADVGADNTLYEITGKNSDGVPYRCYITETYKGVSQTCFEYKQS